MNNNKQQSVTQKRLRDLAVRALQVAERYKDHVGIAAAAQTVVPAASAYITAYDDAVKYRDGQASHMEEGRKGLLELERVMRMGVAIVYSARPTFDARELEGTLDTPDRLISDARKILTILGEAGTPAAGQISGALKQALEQAEAQWGQARLSRLDLQQRQAELREHAIVINRELVALRRIVHAALGTSNHAYQMLRVARVMGDTEEETPVVEETDEVASAVVQSTNGVSNGAKPASLFATPAE